MSKLKESLLQLWKGVKNIDQVIEGYRNQIKMENNELTYKEVDEIVRRRVICSQCPFNSENAKASQEYFDLFGKHYETSLENLHCSLCTCPIDRKTACLSCNCGINNYNIENPDKIHLPLKWTSYESNNFADPTDNVVNDNK